LTSVKSDASDETSPHHGDWKVDQNQPLRRQIHVGDQSRLTWVVEGQVVVPVAEQDSGIYSSKAENGDLQVTYR
jgi:hypothetical protein